MSAQSSRPATPLGRSKSVLTHYSNYPGPNIIKGGTVAERVRAIHKVATPSVSPPSTVKRRLSPTKEGPAKAESETKDIPDQGEINKTSGPPAKTANREDGKIAEKDGRLIFGVSSKDSPAPSWSDKEVVKAFGGLHKASKKNRELFAKSQTYNRIQRKFKSLEDFSKRNDDQEHKQEEFQRPSTSTTQRQDEPTVVEDRYKESQSKNLMNQLENLLDDALEEHTKPPATANRSEQRDKLDHASPSLEHWSRPHNLAPINQSTILRRRSMKPQGRTKSHDPKHTSESVFISPTKSERQRKKSSTATTAMPTSSPETPRCEYDRKFSDDYDPPHAHDPPHTHTPLAHVHSQLKGKAAVFGELRGTSENEESAMKAPTLETTPKPSDEPPVQHAEQPPTSKTKRIFSPWPFGWRLVLQDKKPRATPSPESPGCRPWSGSSASPRTTAAPPTMEAEDTGEGQKNSSPPPPSDKATQSESVTEESQAFATPVSHLQPRPRIATSLKSNSFIERDTKSHRKDQEFQFEDKKVRLSIVDHGNSRSTPPQTPSRRRSSTSAKQHHGLEDPFQVEKDNAKVTRRKSSRKMVTTRGETNGYTIAVEVRSGQGKDEEVFKLTADVTPKGSKRNSRRNSDG